MKTFRLQESKTTLLKKLLNNGNITEEQFHIADDFFKNHTAFEKEIDWNRGLNITWDELSSVIYKERNNKSQARKKIRKGLEGFTEGKDYLVLDEGIYNGEPWVAYQPRTWEASRMIASHYVEPTEGYNGDLDAGWCTAYQKDRTYWDDHSEQEAFIYLCGETIPTKKVAISISEEDYDASGSEFFYTTESLINYNIWDFKDNNDTLEDEEILDIIPNLYDIIEKSYNIWKAQLFQLLYNFKTKRYDYEYILSSSIVKKFIRPDKDGFTIDFGVIKGGFDCSCLGLKSLKGAPQEVGGGFNCSENQLTSLEGAPQILRGWFDCHSNNLISLEGAPKTIETWFDCSYNKLTSLEGAPQTVGGIFEGIFDCSYNHLTSLKGAPQTVGGNFNCTNNPNLHTLEGIGEVKGKIYKDF